MNRLAIIAGWFVVIVVSAFMLYRVKYEVQALRVQIAETARELEHEKETMHVVAAEWAYLNRPERLQKLAERYLSDTEITVHQVAEVEAIPFPRTMQAAVTSETSIVPAAFQGSHAP